MCERENEMLCNHFATKVLPYHTIHFSINEINCWTCKKEKLKKEKEKKTAVAATNVN